MGRPYIVENTRPTLTHLRFEDLAAVFIEDDPVLVRNVCGVDCLVVGRFRTDPSVYPQVRRSYVIDGKPVLQSSFHPVSRFCQSEA